MDITRVVGGEVRLLELNGTSARLLVHQKLDVDVERSLSDRHVLPLQEILME